MTDYSHQSDRELLVQVARDTSTAAATLAALKERIERNEKEIRHQGARLQRLENLRWWLYGAIAAAFGSFGHFIGTMLRK